MPSRKRFFGGGPLKISSRLNPLLPLTFLTAIFFSCQTDSIPTVGRTSLRVCLCTYSDRSIPEGKQSTALRARWWEGVPMLTLAQDRSVLRQSLRPPALPPVREIGL